MVKMGDSYIHKKLSLQINLKDFCNLRCSYCIVPEMSKNNKHESSDNLIDNLRLLLDKIEQETYDLQKVFFMGAEPTVVEPNIVANLILQIRHRFPKCIIAIHTNGVLLTKTYIDTMFANNVRDNDFQVFWSIDGVKNIHDKNRNNSYDRAMENLIYVLDNTKIKSKVSCVTTLEHFDDGENEKEFIEWISFLRSKGSMPSLSYVNFELAGVSNVSITNNIFAQKYANFLIKNDIVHISHKIMSAGYCYKDGNKCYKTLLDINNGKVYLCEKEFDPERVLCNWFDMKISEIMDIRCDITTNAKISPECFKCEFASWCMGGCPIRRDDTGLANNCAVVKTLFTHIKENINPDWRAYLMEINGGHL